MSSPTATIAPGTVGRQIRVRSNLVPMTLSDTNRWLYSYSVSFTPTITSAPVRYLMISEMRRKIPKTAPLCFDGTATCYSFSPVTNDDESSLLIEICDPKFVDIVSRKAEASVVPEKRPASVSNSDKGLLPAAASDITDALSPNTGPSVSDVSVSDPKPKQFHIRMRIKLNARVPMSSISQYYDALRSSSTSPVKLVYPHLALQALQVIVRATVLSTYKSPVMIGSSSFDLAAAATSPSLGGGAVLLRGFFQAPRLTASGLLMNVDISSTDIIKVQSLIEYLVSALDLRSVADIPKCRHNELNEKARNLRITTTHAVKRRYCISHFGEPAGRKMILTPSGESISVFDYFTRTYPGSVSYRYLPVVHVRSKSNIVLPMEVLEILEGQRVLPDISAKQRLALLDLTCLPPSVRLDLARAEAANLALSKPLITQGVHISPQLADVPARILPAMPVYMGSTPAHMPGPGLWTAQNSRFSVPTSREIKSPLIVIASPRLRGQDDPAIARVINALISLGERHGVRISKPTKALSCSSPRDVELQLASVKTPPDFVFGFCAANDPGYVVIKRECELRWGIASQCFNSANIVNERKCNDQYLLNILLKINAKLGGVNFSPSKTVPILLRDKPTLVLGADVSHETMNDLLSHSAVVGSLDPYATQYGGIVQQQGARVEGIPTDNMTRVAGYHIRAFRAATKRIPERIIFYRDGVSDSQISDLITSEVGGIARACLQLGFKAEIVCMTAVKRHHIRFHGNTGLDRSGNLQAGVVIDSHIVRPGMNEFFLYGHAGLKGTSRPCLYQVVYNESKHGMDAMQELSFYMSHLLQRSCRTVSLPAPVYLAHLLAYRARYYSPRYSQAPAASAPAPIDSAAAALAAVEWPVDKRVKPELYKLPYYL